MIRSAGRLVAIAALVAACAQDPQPAIEMVPEAPRGGPPPRVDPLIDPEHEAKIQVDRTLEEITPERRRLFYSPRPASERYRLRPSDLVDIKTYNATGQPLPIEDVTKQVRLFLDGSITLGFLGRIQAAGKEPEALADEIRGRLVEFVREPRVSVVVLEFNKDRVTVLGEFPKTGPVEFAPPTSLLQLLGTVGWDPNRPSHERVLLVRRGVPLAIDVRRLLETHDFERDPLLEDGDLVYSMPRDPIVLLGETMSKPRFEIRGRARLDLHQALLLAGGLTFAADLGRATLVRSGGAHHDLDLNAYLFGSGAPEVQLYPGDVVVLPPVSEKSIFIFGVVEKAGLYTFKNPISVAHALSLANPVRYEADLDRIAIIRGFGKVPQITWVDLDDVLDRTAPNPEVRDGDIVYVPRKGMLDILDSINRIMQPSTQAAGLGPTYGYTPLRTETIRGPELPGSGDSGDE